MQFTKTFKVDSMFKIIKYTVTLAKNVQNMNPVQLKFKKMDRFHTLYISSGFTSLRPGTKL